MKRIVMAFLALIPAVASAQSVPQMDRRVTLAGPTGLNWALGTKADVNNGALKTPVITGGTATGLVQTGSTMDSTSVLNGTAAGNATATALAGKTPRTLAGKLGDTLSVLDFGAVCDGKTDDTAAFNAAFSAAADTYGTGTHRVIIGHRSCFILGTVNLPRGVWLQGSGASGARLTVGPLAQIVMGGGTEEGHWRGAQISDLYFDASAQTSKSPFVIDMATNQPVRSMVRNVDIEGGAWYGIDASGNNVVIDNAMIQGVHGIGIREGHGSTGGNNTDPKITNTTVSGDYVAGDSSSSSAILTQILDAGGLTLQNNDMVGGLVGTQIMPGANQTVFHLFASNTVLSDSAQQYGLQIDTGASSATAVDMKFEGSWTANAQSKDVSVFNNGGGSVQSILFIGHRYYLANGDAVHAGPNVHNITITASQFCGNSPNGTGIYVDAGDNGFNITNNRMPAICAGEGTGNSGTAVSLAGNNNNTVVSGNDMSGAPYGINFSGGAGLTDYIEGNIGANTVSRAVAAASLTTLPNQVVDYVTLSSSNGETVLNINGQWMGRRVFLYNAASSAINFGSGTNICNAYSLAVKATVQADYTAQSCWYLH